MEKKIHRKISISAIFDPQDNYTFLVGAGVSMELPSDLPSAREMVKAIVELCVPAKYVNSILSLKSLQFEILIEKIRNVIKIDPDVEFLDYFDNDISPNLIHMFIASLIIQGNGRHNVITTNFDFLLERAFMSLLKEDEKEKILPIITKSDFSNYKNYQSIYKQGKYPICKIHGSKKNIITNLDTSDSLVTDMTSFGKNRREGETFAMEPFKKPLANSLMQGQTLVVMGYSGGDDFDITPMLKEIRNLKRMIWIEHSSQKKPQIFKISKNQDFKSGNNSKSTTVKSSTVKSTTEQLLRELSNFMGYDIYLIKINTLHLVEAYLDHIFLNGNLKKKTHLKSTKKTDYKKWSSNDGF